jgi:S-adenosylmethionine/arginine decarboxylase-like enzyme
VTTTGPESNEPFGWSAHIDLYDCTEATLHCRESIQQFVNSLCDDVLGMTRHGDPLIERFGFNDVKATGFSFVQLIETSTIVGHISEARHAVYLDIFSCRPFDANSAVKHAIEHFGASSTVTGTTVRQ